MKSRPAKSGPPSPASEVERPEIIVGAGLANLKQSISHAIAYHAYELYETRGGGHGNDLEDWFHAEADFTRPIPVEVGEAGDQLILRAQIPGFSAGEVKIGVEPRRVLIWGSGEPSPPPETADARRSPVLRTVDLPQEVDPAGAQATLRDCVLEISLGRRVR
jgi:HSP20 family protein